MCISVLVPIVVHSLWRITTAAIRLEMRIIKNAVDAEPILPMVAPGLLKVR